MTDTGIVILLLSQFIIVAYKLSVIADYLKQIRDILKQKDNDNSIKR